MDKQRVIEEVELFFLEEAIDQNQDEKWIKKMMGGFQYWFNIEKIDRSIVEAVWPSLSSASLLKQWFLEDCPDGKVFEKKWGSRAVALHYSPIESKESQIRAALSYESIQKYLSSFSPSYVVGSGKKPGKSFLIRYLEKITNERIHHYGTNATRYMQREHVTCSNGQGRVDLPGILSIIIESLDSEYGYERFGIGAARVSAGEVLAHLEASMQQYKVWR